MTEHVHQHDYLPGTGHRHRLMPFYDVIAAVTGMRTDHRTLVRQAGLADGHRVLEIGCGTGNLSVLAKRMHPATEVVGIDPDAEALARARKKATRRPVRFDLGYGQELPYLDESFDRVLSAFMLHHLDGEVRARTLREARRVLRTDGALYLLDFGGRVSASDGFAARRQLRSAMLEANLGDGVPAALRAAGFADCAELSSRIGRFGRVTHYRAVR